MQKKIKFFILSFLLLITFTTPALAFEMQFDNQFIDAECFPEITYAVNKGWIELRNNRFMTYEYIKKDKFAKMLSKVAGMDKNLKKPAKPTFTDVPVTNQYFSYIETMKDFLPYEKTQNGLLKFKPNSYITREQAIFSVIKALNYKTNMLKKYDKKKLSQLIADSESVSKEYIPYVAIAAEDGLISTTKMFYKNQVKYYLFPQNYADNGWLAYIFYMATIPTINDKDKLFNYILNSIKSDIRRLDFRYSKISETDVNEVFSEVDRLTTWGFWNLEYDGAYGFESCNGYKAYSKNYKRSNMTDEKLSELKNKASQILKQIIKPGMSDEEKIKAIHDYIVKNTRYDYENFLNNTIPEDSYTAYGVLVKGTGVCSGYSSAFSLLAQMAGIPAIDVAGEVFNTTYPGSHGWNMVKVNGEVRYIDVTWDDPVPDRGPDYVRYDYFLLTAEQLKKDHSWDENFYNPRYLDLLQKYILNQ